MTATPPEVTAPTGPKPTEPPAAATTPPEAPKPTDPPQPTAPPNAAATEPGKANVWDDPETAKAEIEKLRRENGAARTNAKAQAAEDAKKELAQTIGKALGLVEDETEIDPAALTENLTAAQAEAKRARVELAVYRNADTAGGDPVALLDSTSFLRSLEAINPEDATAVAAAIKAAVEANPSRLGAAPADPRAPKPNPAQGSSASSAPTPEEQAAQAAAAGDWKASSELKAERLLQLREHTT